MNPSVRTLALLAGLGIAAAVAVPANAEIFPYPVHRETLPNGLTVVVVPMHSGGLASYWSIVRTGSRDEVEKGHTGFAHFFEHMMFRGTEKFPAEVYNEKITSIGADANAFTSDDLTAYFLSIAAADLETVVELESDRFQNLSYSEPEFETEAGAVYGEYRKNRTSPFFTVIEAVRKAAFTTHTYGHLTMGYEDDIRAMPGMFDYSKSFFARFYRPENVVILIVGDVEPQPTLELIKRYYGDWKPGYQAPTIPVEPEQTQERRVEVHYEGSTLPVVWMAYKSRAFDPADRTLLAADLLCSLLFGETSELYKKLVLEDQVVETIAAGINVNRDPGVIDLYARIKDPTKIDDVIAQIDEALAGAQTTPPDPQRLKDVQSRLKYQFLMGLDTPQNVAARVVRIVAVTGSIDAVDTLYATYDQVTPDDVLTAARELFEPAKRTLAVLKGDR